LKCAYYLVVVEKLIDRRYVEIVYV